ncbi:MAG: hypothetical protein KGH58_01955 [Candidatus Micrarchaeota archaeon]|nr:hypothetical protein [Candidatus Micrarchaeota archaeon]
MIPMQLPALVTLPGMGLIPLVAIALALDGAIVGIWYLAGVALSNNKVRGSAREEFYQLIGTAIMMGIIIGALAMFSGLFYSALGSTQLMSPTAITQMCNNIQNGGGINLLSGPNSLLAHRTQGQFPGICDLVSKKAAPSVKDQIDYPLAATTVIIANLTNQTVSNLNSTFVYDSFIGFLSQLTPTVSFCVPDPSVRPVSLVCVNPAASALPEEKSPIFTMTYSATPDSGFDMLFNNLVAYGTLMGSAMEAMMAQLLVSVVMLYIWPVMLFAGIVLRAVFFTRKIGGLLIAISIGMVMFFPAVYAFEYLGMAHGVPTSVGTAYGFNPVTNIPASPVPSSTATYQLNFFVMPNLRTVIQHYQCWPSINTQLVGQSQTPTSVPIAQAEIYDVAYLTVPALSLIPLVQGGLQVTPGSVPHLPLPADCGQEAAVNAMLALIDTYGIVGMSAYLLPLLNLLIMLTGVLGLSGQLGGDTSLAGLAKII